MKVMVASLFLLLGAVLLQAGTADKPGDCPARFTFCRGKNLYSCIEDSDCPRDKKCCFVCGKQCVPPIKKEKPGKCPISTEPCQVAPDPKCTLDSECPRDQKCCSVCGMKCVDPVVAADETRCENKMDDER